MLGSWEKIYVIVSQFDNILKILNFIIEIFVA